MQARWDRLRRSAAIGTTVAAVMLGATACAGSTSSVSAKAAPTASSGPTASSSDRPAVTPAAGLSPCSGIKRVFLDLATVSAAWDPQTDPFDAHTAAAFTPLIHRLRTESKSATSPRTKAVVARNADALAHLATAMKSHQQQGVTAALAESRSAYAALPGCARRDGRATHAKSATGVAKGSSSGPATSPATGPATGSQTGIVARTAKDPGCLKAKAAYQKLGTVTSTWDISSDPFDDTVARAFRDTATALHSAAADAKIATVAKRVEANSAAFGLLADAMGSHDASKVDDSVITMQQTAVTLATTCPLS